MSRHSSTHRELIRLAVRTSYSDENGPVWRGRYLEWGVLGWEGTVDITGRPHPKFKTRPQTWFYWIRTELRYFRWRFTAQHFPFDPVDGEQMYYQFKRKETTS